MPRADLASASRPRDAQVLPLDSSAEALPTGVYDVNGQQLDLRAGLPGPSAFGRVGPSVPRLALSSTTCRRSSLFTWLCRREVDKRVWTVHSPQLTPKVLLSLWSAKHTH